jgi:RimJ/RimL family protein N-acetyltransferase
MKINIPQYFEQESERLIFRKLTPNDIKSWEDFFDNNNRLHFLGIDTSKTKEELAKTWIKRQFERYRDEGLGLLATIEKNSGLFIGMVGIIPREIDGNPEFEIAYSLKPLFWRKGYGTEMATQMKSFGRENGISKDFISIIHKENYDSRNVASKNGMTILKETTFLDMDVFIYGTKHDSNEKLLVTPATIADIKTIQSIAYRTWPDTFGNILSSEQIDYMLEMMYSEKSLKEQINEKKHQFFLVKEANVFLGYASIETDYQNSKKTKIHKLYVLPQSQGKGIGRTLLKKITEEAKKHDNMVLSLNVNKFNKAVLFYEKVGFTIVGNEDIDIGNGFLMEDYIMEKEI